MHFSYPAADVYEQILVFLVFLSLPSSLTPSIESSVCFRDHSFCVVVNTCTTHAEMNVTVEKKKLLADLQTIVKQVSSRSCSSSLLIDNRSIVLF